MTHLKTRITALCLLLILSIASPVQVHTTDQNFVSIQKDVTVSAKKKSVMKKSTKKSVTVYVTPTGKCYHRYACGRGSYSKSSLKSAKARGLRPCQKCY